MKIKQTAIAGTLESSDIQIIISQGQGLTIDIESPVLVQFGNQIRKVITDTLKAYGITDAKIKAVDEGALDCVIKARTMAAAQRALGTTAEPNWEVL